MTSRQGVGAPNPNWIPVANDISRRAAAKIDGDPRGWYFDVFNRPTTAHFIGAGKRAGGAPPITDLTAHQVFRRRRLCCR